MAQAEDRLKTILARTRAFRDREGLIDPARAAEASGALAARLRDELVRANTDLAILKGYMRDEAPSVQVLAARIRAIEAQLRSLGAEMTDPEEARSDRLTRRLGDYEQIESERRFAEASYQLALRAVEQARASADRQRVFIASFVPPSLPEEALYPRRWRTLGTVALIAIRALGDRRPGRSVGTRAPVVTIFLRNPPMPQLRYASPPFDPGAICGWPYRA